MFKELLKNFEDTSPVENQTESGPEDKVQAKREKRAGQRTENIIRRLEENKIPEAREALSQPLSLFDDNYKKDDNETMKLVEEKIAPYIKEKIIKAIVNKSGE